MGLEAPTLFCSQKSMFNFWFPQNLTTKSQLLTKGLMDNSQLTHILYVTCIIYCILTIKYAKENVIKKIRKRKYIILHYIALYLFIKKNLCVSGFMQFILLLCARVNCTCLTFLNKSWYNSLYPKGDLSSDIQLFIYHKISISVFNQDLLYVFFYIIIMHFLMNHCTNLPNLVNLLYSIYMSDIIFST